MHVYGLASMCAYIEHNGLRNQTMAPTNVSFSAEHDAAAVQRGVLPTRRQCTGRERLQPEDACSALQKRDFIYQ